MAGSETTPAHANWGRWPAQQPASEYVIPNGLIEYDSRSINAAPLQRQPATGPFLVNNPYSMAPVANLPAPHHHTSNPFGFDSYGPPSPESVVSTFRQYQEPLPALRHSSGEDRRTYVPGYPSQERAQGYVERETRRSPQVKSEPRTLTPGPLTPNSAVELEVNIPINVNNDGANKVSTSIIGVDSLMMTIQMKEEPRKNKSITNDRGASRYPSPPQSARRPPPPKFGFATAVEDKPYVCKIERCGQRFPQKTHLETHKRKHTGERPYRCQIPSCGKTFTQQGNLKVHHNRHKGIRPYGCDQCDKRFTQKANLTAHRDTHSGIKRFQCLLDGCGKRFGQRGNMKSHMNKFHAKTVEALRMKFEQQRDHEMTSRELEMRSWFAHMFRHSNRGIKGRGKGRFVKLITEHPENVVSGAVPSHRQEPQQLQQQQQQHQRQPQHPVQYNLPMHSLPPPHTTIGQHHISGGIGGGFPPCGVPRNDDHHQGNGSVMSRGPHHSSYGMYDMDHSGMESHSPSSCSSTNGSTLDDDRHRGFGFQDRFHERLY